MRDSILADGGISFCIYYKKKLLSKSFWLNIFSKENIPKYGELFVAPIVFLFSDSGRFIDTGAVFVEPFIFHFIVAFFIFGTPFCVGAFLSFACWHIILLYDISLNPFGCIFS